MEQEKLKFMEEWIDEEYGVSETIEEFTETEYILGGDEIMIEELVWALEEEFDCDIYYEDVLEAETFGEIAKLAS